MLDNYFLKKIAVKGNLMQPLALGSFRNWVSLLKEQEVPPRFWGRAMYVSLTSLLFAPVRAYQHWRYDRVFARVQVKQAPIFVLGHWRSGTTHLHNLLTQDRRFGYVSALQVIAPDFFYVAGESFKTLLRKGTPENRMIDNMAWSIDSPQEEEMALGNMSPHSFYLFWSFPQKAQEYFQRYAVFEDASREMIEEWKAAYVDVLKKATLNMKGRRLVVKNPVNTGRIPVLLEMFPNAKFIFLHRNPYDVFLSTRNLYRKTLPHSQLQEISDAEVDKNILTFYEGLLRHYLRDRELVPKQNLIEISYAALDENPMSTIRRIYQRLNFWHFSRVRGRLRQYLDSLSGYKKNRYEISAEDIRKVNARWQFAFDAWGYERREM